MMAAPPLPTDGAQAGIERCVAGQQALRVGWRQRYALEIPREDAQRIHSQPMSRPARRSWRQPWPSGAHRYPGMRF